MRSVSVRSSANGGWIVTDAIGREHICTTAQQMLWEVALRVGVDTMHHNITVTPKEAPHEPA